MPQKLELIIPPERIESIVKELAGRIRADYRDKNPLFIGVLRGAFVFTADLVRALDIPLEVDFIHSSSYRNGAVPDDGAAVSAGLKSEVRDRDVIVVEGIVDRGVTVRAVTKRLGGLHPASIRICTLLVRDGQKDHLTPVDYAGMTIGKGFVVGYGMDYDGGYRGLPGIYLLKDGP